MIKRSIIRRQEGFTLVELAIVIVIIGLLVGGVLQGQELIRQAKQRRLMADIGGYNAAIFTFYGKYNCMPGDCPNAYRLLGPECGDNSPVDEGGCNGDGNRTLSREEGKLLWAQLSLKKIIKGAYYAATNNVDRIPQAPFDGRIMAIFSKGDPTGSGCRYEYCSASNELGGMNSNIFLVGSYNSSDDLTNSLYLPRLELIEMDTKYDDGKYFSGSISASMVTTETPSGLLSSSCGNATTKAYYTADTVINGITMHCPLAFKLNMN